MNFGNRILFVYAAIVLATAVTSRVSAAGSVHEQGPLDAFKEADVVFAGRAIERCTRIKKGTSGTRPLDSWTFDVLAIWKGNIDARVLVDVETGLPALSLDRLYIVYATGASDSLVSERRTGEYGAALIDRFLLPKPSKIAKGFEVREVSLDDIIQSVIDGAGTNAVEEFKWLQAAAGRIVPVFLSVLQSQKPGDPWVAMGVLGCMGSSSRVAIPDLEREAAAPSERLRIQAVEALDRIETDTSERLRRLLEALHDPSPRLRLMVVGLISRAMADAGTDADLEPVVARLAVIGQSEPDSFIRKRIEIVLEEQNAKQ